MESVQVNQKTNRGMRAKSPLWSIGKLVLYLIVAFMAAMTLTACVKSDEDEDDKNGNSGGIAGKRLKTEVNNTADFVMRNEFTYNSDGSLKRYDLYDDGTSKLFMYAIVTNNLDGTSAKEELYYADGPLYQVYKYTYDSNKKPKKTDISFPGQTSWSITIDYIFQNGRKTREVLTSDLGTDKTVVQTDYNYDSKGVRTSATETHSVLGKRQITYTYSADGTLQKRTYTEYNSTKMITHTYTWEDGKSTVNWFDSALF